MLHEELTGSILSAFYEVHRELGHGFLESVYERAMLIALKSRGLDVVRQAPIEVYFSGRTVGHFCADLSVEHAVIIEVKSCPAILPVHEAQLLNHLRATQAEVGLLLLFAPKAAFRRFVFTNDRKPNVAVGAAERMVIPETVEA